MSNYYTVDQVRAIMESAGKTMLMLSPAGTRPAGYGSSLPEHVVEFADLIENPKKNKTTIRATSRQMTELEMVQDWMMELAIRCKNKNMPYVARTVSYGIQRFPDTDRKVFNWSRLGRKMGCSPTTAKKWYIEGMNLLTTILNGRSQGSDSSRGNIVPFKST